ncbi:MAG: DHH family phosphoesterase, partial [bacterium]
MKELQKAFSRAKTALIASHIDPDGDSIGSMLCLGMLLEKLGIKCDFYSQDGVPRIYKFLHCSQKVKNYVLANKHYDILVTLDSSDLKRIGNKVQPKKIANKIINIDHHPDNTKYGDVNFVEASSSTAEILFKIAKDLKIEIDKFMAEALYVALVTDTGNFRYENTSEKTFLMAAELIQAGIKTHDITTKIYDTKKVSSILLFSAVLSTLETSENKKVAWAVVS